MNRLKSFRYAFRGIIHCIKNERNMRIHTVVASYVLLFSCFFNLSPEKYAILLLTISAVMSAEMVNTATEELSDLSAEDYNPMARIAKDVAAGAVLISALFSVVIGFILFFDINAFLKIINFFMAYPVMILIFLLSFFASCLYIKLGPTGLKNAIKKIKYKIKVTGSR